MALRFEGLYQGSGSVVVNLAWYGTWQKRLLWTIAGVVWLAIISLPVLALLLAVRGELSWQPGDFRQYRVWVVMEEDERGLGWEVRRVASRSVRDTCLQTTVGFWLWQGQQSRSIFCECYSSYSSGDMDYLGSCDAIETG